ncbi:unnamed protein product [Pylaiella littoralis]
MLQSTKGRCHVPCTALEKRVASVCSRRAELRAAHEVSWLASHLRRIPALENIAAWKLESLGRNMAAAFVRAGDDASLLCGDPAFSYFLVSGSLSPIAVSTNPAVVESPLHGNGSSSSSSLHRAPGEEATSIITESDVRQQQQPFTRFKLHSHEAPLPEESGGHNSSCGNWRLSGPASGSWSDSPFDNNSRGTTGCSVLNNVAEQDERGASGLMDNGSDVESTAASRNCFFHAGGWDLGQKGSLVLPGQSLDFYLVLSSFIRGVGEIGRDGDHHEAKYPGAVPTASEGLLDDVETGLRWWRLDAREGACIGRVFGDGFSDAVLERLAILMEREEKAAGAVVRRKGGSVKKVVLLFESGDSVRLGDSRADSMKNGSSLRIRAGQVFGAEEAMSGSPGYTANLMALSQVRFFAIPVVAFLQAIGGVWTEPLYRLRSKARLVHHECNARSGGQPRPSTATGIGGERSTARWNGSGDKSLPTFLPSATRSSPVTLTPVPLFSGLHTRNDLEKR